MRGLGELVCEGLVTPDDIRTTIRELIPARLRVLLWLGLAVSAWLLVRSQGGPGRWYEQLVEVLAVVLAVLAAGIMLAPALLSHTMLRGKTDEQRRVRVELDARGFSVKSGLGSVSDKWSSLKDVEESKDAFILRRKGLALVIFKRDFGAGDLPLARGLLREHAPRYSTSSQKAFLLFAKWGVLVAIFLALLFYLDP